MSRRGMEKKGRLIRFLLLRFSRRVGSQSKEIWCLFIMIYFLGESPDLLGLSFFIFKQKNPIIVKRPS